MSRVPDQACRGCEEYDRLSRRRFLGLGGAALAAVSAPAWLPRVAYADSHDSARDVLVSVFLRGGADGLTLCVPFGEAAYYRHRPTLAVPPPDASGTARAIDLDGFFGLPPAMAALESLYRAGNLALIHACGQHHPTRSHFDAMHFMEVGQGDPPASRVTGWLGRHLAATAPSLPDALVRAIGVGYGLQRSLVGGPQAVPVRDLASYGFEGDPSSEAARRATVAAMYAAADDVLAGSAANTFRTIELLGQIDVVGYLPGDGAVYPDSDLGTALRSAAALIRADVGIEAIAIDVGGWDTHDEQAPIDGKMAQIMAGLADGLAAFRTDLSASGRDDVTTVAMSEFGRNAIENGSLGTDHGHGNVMMVLGAQVDGGRVVTHWPGLEIDQLYEGQDLEVTIDYRDVLAEIITKRTPNADIRTVFDDPSFVPVDRGVILG